jgi:hypothetical protein
MEISALKGREAREQSCGYFPAASKDFLCVAAWPACREMEGEAQYGLQ